MKSLVNGMVRLSESTHMAQLSLCAQQIRLERVLPCAVVDDGMDKILRPSCGSAPNSRGTSSAWQVDGTFSLSEGLAAFKMAQSKGALKVQFVVSDSEQESATERREGKFEEPAPGGAGAAVTGNSGGDELPPAGQEAG